MDLTTMVFASAAYLLAVLAVFADGLRHPLGSIHDEMELNEVQLSLLYFVEVKWRVLQEASQETKACYVREVFQGGRTDFLAHP